MGHGLAAPLCLGQAPCDSSCQQKTQPQTTAELSLLSLLIIVIIIIIVTACVQQDVPDFFWGALSNIKVGNSNSTFLTGADQCELERERNILGASPKKIPI